MVLVVVNLEEQVTEDKKDITQICTDLAILKTSNSYQA